MARALFEIGSMLATAADGAAPGAGSGAIADVVTGVALVAGIAMWLFGARLVRPLQALLFGAVGALIGYLAPAAVAVDLDPLITLGVGAFLGALLGIATFRLTMALTLCLMLAVVFPLGMGVALRANPELLAGQQQEPLTAEEQFLPGVPIEEEDGSSPDEGAARFDGTVSNLVFSEAEGESPLDIELSEEQKEALRARAEQLQRFLRALFDEMRAEWSALPRAHQIALVLSAALGGIIGLLAGMSAPKRVAAVTTACLGSGVFLASAALLLRTHGPEMAGRLPTTGAAWALVWLVISAIGALLQWTALRPKADKKPRD